MFRILTLLGLGAAAQEARIAVRGATLTIAAYLMLGLGLMLALGFATAAGLMALANAYGAIPACLIVGGLYFVVALLICVVLLAMRPKRAMAQTASQAWGDLQKSTERAVADGGLKSVATAAAVAFVAGALLRKRR